MKSSPIKWNFWIIKTTLADPNWHWLWLTV